MCTKLTRTHNKDAWADAEYYPKYNDEYAHAASANMAQPMPRPKSMNTMMTDDEQPYVNPAKFVKKCL